MYLHPLDPSMKCQHCGKGDLEFVRTRAAPRSVPLSVRRSIKAYTVHCRVGGKSCGVGAELHYGVIGTWVECAGRELAKREE